MKTRRRDAINRVSTSRFYDSLFVLRWYLRSSAAASLKAAWPD